MMGPPCSLCLLIVTTCLHFLMVAGEGESPPETTCSSQPQSGEECDDGRSSASRVWTKTQHTLTHFPVAGVDLAVYGMKEKENVAEPSGVTPFELYEEFDIGHLVQGNESWMEITVYKRKQNHPILSFYNDKVALKRWLPSVGFDIPALFVLLYASEFIKSGELEETKKAISNLLPKRADYVAKPSHKYLSIGVQIVSYDAETGATRISEADEALHEKADFDTDEVAASLAENLHDDLPEYAEALTRANKAGLVVEQRFTYFDRDDDAALEFKVVTLWGRVHVANWRRGGWRGNWWPGVVHRNGTMVEGSEIKKIPDFVNWSRVVDIAERLGAHKDMFRVDIFVGVPAGSPALRKETSESERRAAVQYVVSEVSSLSWEPFPAEVWEEAERLWIAGYKIGNYRLVPNTEVPLELQEAAKENPKH